VRQSKSTANNKEPPRRAVPCRTQRAAKSQRPTRSFGLSRQAWPLNQARGSVEETGDERFAVDQLFVLAEEEAKVAALGKQPKEKLKRV
jgi:hypothetical protein